MFTSVLLYVNVVVTLRKKEDTMNSNKSRTLQKNIEFFTAALSQTVVSVWQEDSAGVYCEIARGHVEMFSNDKVRLRSEDGREHHYSRDTVIFQTEV